MFLYGAVVSFRIAHILFFGCMNMSACGALMCFQSDYLDISLHLC